jgi:hypothetical protein
MGDRYAGRSPDEVWARVDADIKKKAMKGSTKLVNQDARLLVMRPAVAAKRGVITGDALVEVG